MPAARSPHSLYITYIVLQLVSVRLTSYILFRQRRPSIATRPEIARTLRQRVLHRDGWRQQHAQQVLDVQPRLILELADRPMNIANWSAGEQCTYKGLATNSKGMFESLRIVPMQIGMSNRGTPEM